MNTVYALLATAAVYLLVAVAALWPAVFATAMLIICTAGVFYGFYALFSYISGGSR